MMDRPPPAQNTNTAALRNVAIFIIVFFLLSTLWRWNSRQAAEEETEIDGGQRLCEVRAAQDGLSGDCALVDGRWLPVEQAGTP